MENIFEHMKSVQLPGMTRAQKRLYNGFIRDGMSENEAVNEAKFWCPRRIRHNLLRELLRHPVPPFHSYIPRHPDCYLQKSELEEMSNVLPNRRFRDRFIYLTYYLGESPFLTLKSMLSLPEVQQVSGVVELADYEPPSGPMELRVNYRKRRIPPHLKASGRGSGRSRKGGPSDRGNASGSSNQSKKGVSSNRGSTTVPANRGRRSAPTNSSSSVGLDQGRSGILGPSSTNYLGPSQAGPSISNDPSPLDHENKLGQHFDEQGCCLESNHENLVGTQLIAQPGLQNTLHSSIEPLQPSPSREDHLGACSQEKKSSIFPTFPIYIVPMGYPSERFSDQQMDAVESALLEAILNIDDQLWKPTFQDSFRSNGRYGVICKNQSSYNWLACHLVECKPWPHANLRIMAELSRVKVDVKLPLCKHDDNDRILAFIAKQNCRLDVSRWEVVKRLDSDSHTSLILIIDKQSAKLLKSDGTINFKMKQAEILVVDDLESDVQGGMTDIGRKSEVSGGRVDKGIDITHDAALYEPPKRDRLFRTPSPEPSRRDQSARSSLPEPSRPERLFRTPSPEPSRRDQSARSSLPESSRGRSTQELEYSRVPTVGGLIQRDRPKADSVRYPNDFRDFAQQPGPSSFHRPTNRTHRGPQQSSGTTRNYSRWDQPKPGQELNSNWSHFSRRC